MKTVTVSRVIPAPRDRVFAMLSDHAGYARFPGIRKAVLREQGSDHANGTGALREIDAGKLRLLDGYLAAPLQGLTVEANENLPHAGGELPQE